MQKFPKRHTPLLTSFFMSMFMAFIMSGIVTLINRGFSPEYLTQWMKAYFMVWPIAFAVLFVLRPLVMNIVSRITEPN